jgi:hypothetical protein
VWFGAVVRCAGPWPFGPRVGPSALAVVWFSSPPPALGLVHSCLLFCFCCCFGCCLGSVASTGLGWFSTGRRQCEFEARALRRVPSGTPRVQPLVCSARSWCLAQARDFGGCAGSHVVWFPFNKQFSVAACGQAWPASPGKPCSPLGVRKTRSRLPKQPCPSSQLYLRTFLIFPLSTRSPGFPREGPDCRFSSETGVLGRIRGR